MKAVERFSSPEEIRTSWGGEMSAGNAFSIWLPRQYISFTWPYSKHNVLSVSKSGMIFRKHSLQKTFEAESHLSNHTNFTQTFHFRGCLDGEKHDQICDLSENCTYLILKYTTFLSRQFFSHKPQKSAVSFLAFAGLVCSWNKFSIANDTRLQLTVFCRHHWNRNAVSERSAQETHHFACCHVCVLNALSEGRRILALWHPNPLRELPWRTKRNILHNKAHVKP